MRALLNLSKLNKQKKHKIVSFYNMLEKKASKQLFSLLLRKK